MKRANGLGGKRQRFLPNERRRQTWRKHRLTLIDRRSKWFYQQGFNLKLEQEETGD